MNKDQQACAIVLTVVCELNSRPRNKERSAPFPSSLVSVWHKLYMVGLLILLLHVDEHAPDHGGVAVLLNIQQPN